MSKEAEARIREELLQSLYAGVLEAKLAHARAGRAANGCDAGALAAGVCANLRPGDLLLLPVGRGESLRVLRGFAGGGERGPAGAELVTGQLQTGLLELPREEAAAVAVALGAAATLAHGAQGAVACVLTPAGKIGAASAGPRSRAFPRDWAEAGQWAARRGLPLLLLSEGWPRAAALTAKARQKPAHLLPAPLYPTIPVDRDDALAIYRVAFECLARARAGGGPSELQCVPFRARGRQAGVPVEGDALFRLETMLRTRGAFAASWKRQLERDLVRKLST